MSRDLTAGMVTEVTGGNLEPRIFAYLDFPSGAVRVWDGIGNKSWDGETWTGVGTLGSVSFPKETTEVRAEGCVLSLSGVPPSMISLVLSDKPRGRAATVYLACLDGGGSIIADPVALFSGRMDHTTIVEDGETATVNVHCESHFIDLGRASDWRYSHEHQQILFSGDEGFEFAATLPDMELHWNEKNAFRSIPVSSVRPRGPSYG